MNLFQRILLTIMTIATFDLAAQESPQPLPFNPKHYGHVATYIVNPDNVVAIFDNTRRVIHPDMDSFRQVEHSEGVLATDKNGVYYKGLFVKTDPRNITTVGYVPASTTIWLWKNDANVFYGDKAIAGAAPQTFESIEVFNSYYYRDHANIYFLDRRVENADRASFRQGITTFYDKDFVYQGASVMMRDGEPVRSVNHILYKTSKAVYQANRSIGSQYGVPVEGIDPASLRRLTNRLSIDKNHVYSDERAVPIAAADFPRLRYWEERNTCYLTDGKTVYHNTAPQRWLDAASFGMLKNGYIFDKAGIYTSAYDKKALPFRYGAPPTAENTAVSKNSYYVLYENQAFELGEKKLYRPLDDSALVILRNSNQQIKLEKSADGRYRAIEKDEVSERKRYYGFTIRDGVLSHKDKPVTDIQVDVASFEALPHPYYHDRNAVYVRMSAQPADKLQRLADLPLGKLRVYDYAFVTNGTRLFFYDKEIKGIRGGGLELAAIYTGYRPIHSDRPDFHPEPAPQNVYYLFKTSEGFWLVDTTDVREPGLRFIREVAL